MKKYYLFLVFLFITLISGTGYTQNWIQIGKDIDGEAAEDQSGNSIDLSADGSIIAIGGWQNDGNGADAGHVRVFKNNNGIWEQIGNDIVGEEGEKKGFSVSLNDAGDIVALSTPYTNSATGKVSIYNYVNGEWTQMGQDIYGKGEYYYSGYSIELSPDGKLIAISNHANFGFIRLYEFRNETWTMTEEIKGSLWNEQLGGTGIQFNEDAGILAARSTVYAMVRVFRKQTDGNWTQLGDSIPDAHSSFSLSLDSLTIAIGNAGWFGTVKVYKYENDAWKQKGNDMGGWFTGTGYAETVKLSSDGNMVLVSARGNNFSTGLVRTYLDSAGIWIQKGDDLHGEGQYNNFGQNLCLSNNDSVLAVSAHKNSEAGHDAGHVRIFRYKDNVRLFTELFDSVCENELPYQFGKLTLYSEGIFVDTMVAGSGVDSIVTLHLSIDVSPNSGFTFNSDTLTSTNTHFSYQWYDDDGAIEGATSHQYIIGKSGNYYLEVANESGCLAMSEGVLMVKTSVWDIENSENIHVIIPNPNQGRFKIQLSDVKENITLKLINSLGQTIDIRMVKNTLRNHSEQFDVSHLSKGIYHIVISSNDYQKTMKIMVQ